MASEGMVSEQGYPMKQVGVKPRVLQYRTQLGQLIAHVACACIGSDMISVATQPRGPGHSRFLLVVRSQHAIQTLM